jgi:hypothetical protein
MRVVACQQQLCSGRRDLRERLSGPRHVLHELQREHGLRQLPLSGWLRLVFQYRAVRRDLRRQRDMRELPNLPSHCAQRLPRRP